MLGINYEAGSFALTDRILHAVGAYEIGTFNMQIFLMIFYPSADPKQIFVHILNCNFHFVTNKSCDYHLSGVNIILYRTLTCLPSFYSSWLVKKPDISHFFKFMFSLYRIKALVPCQYALQNKSTTILHGL